MNKLKQVKDAILKGFSDSQISAMFGISETLVRKTRELLKQP